jgi:aspartyl protease family protein
MLGLTALYQASMRNTKIMQSMIDSDGTVMLILQRGRDGHYHADGEINGNPVNFLVDTGATDIAVSGDVARSLGLEFGPAITLMTAAGPVQGWITRLDHVSVGPLALQNVRATISEGLGEKALLGMGFLKHFSMVQEGDTLALALNSGTQQ